MDKSFSVMSLPFEYDEMESFIQTYKDKLMEQIVLSVQYALDNDYPTVEVFSFKNSDFIVILTQSEFKDNIDNVFEYYVNTEQYEFCSRLVKLKKQIEQHEQKQQERHKPKSSSKRKDQR
jgi:hypothetical protein